MKNDPSIQADAEQDDPFFGRLNDPTTSAFLRGPCGDEMEYDVTIEEGRIVEIKYFTDGCRHTRTCGAAVARRAKGQTVLDALAINPRDIITAQECLPEEGKHCAILAVSALYRALAAYWMKP